MSNVPKPGMLYRKFNVQELINMTLKKAYYTLIAWVIVTITTILLYAFNVSKMALAWGVIGFTLSTGLSLITLLYALYALKKEKVDDRAHILVRYRYEILDWLSFLGLSMMIIFILFMFFILPSDVSQNSMHPTLSNGDRILLYHFNYEPKRDDVVVIRVNQDDYPLIPTSSFYDQNRQQFVDEIYFVKRIVAVPGDIVTFELIDDQSQRYHMFVNGHLVETPTGVIYMIDPGQKALIEQGIDQQTFRVYDNLYFVLGDNATLSLDSRSFGVIYKKDILGKVIFRFWPMGVVS